MHLERGQIFFCLKTESKNGIHCELRDHDNEILIYKYFIDRLVTIEQCEALCWYFSRCNAINPWQRL